MENFWDFLWVIPWWEDKNDVPCRKFIVQVINNFGDEIMYPIIATPIGVGSFANPINIPDDGGGGRHLN